MRAFMLGTLIMTFLSGATSGYLIGHTPPPPTRADQYLKLLQQRHPDISADDLAKARKIIEDHDERVLEMKSEVQDLLKDQLAWLENNSQKKMDAIIDSYESPDPGPK